MNTSSSLSRLLVMTVLGADQPGIVDRLAGLIREHDGNWLESRMARLGGQFAGVVAVRVPANTIESLRSGLEALAVEGLSVVVQSEASGDPPDAYASPQLRLQVEILSPDRPGILRELTGILAERAVNVEELSTRIVPAEFSGEPLFKAHLLLSLNAREEEDALQQAIQSLATDLALDLTIQYA